MKLNLALFENLKHEYKVIHICDDDGKAFGDDNPEYSRLTETAEVEFVELDQSTIIAGKVAAITAQEIEMRRNYTAQANLLADAKAKLLALPAPKQESK